MTQTADVVVVGGGVNGASITYALASRGVKVVLVEKGALASGASGRSSALVRMHYTNEWDSRLAWASFPVFKHWTELMGGPAVFTHTGFVNVVGPQYADNLRRNVEMLKGLGVNTTAITAAELKELQPFANVEDIGAAAYEPDSGYANPAETVEGFRRRATELGARVLQWTAVTRVIRQESRVIGVETSAGRIDAGSVIVAAGAWSRRLCTEFGLDLPARPKAIDTVAVSRPPELAKGHMVFIDNVQGNYFRPEGDRHRRRAAAARAALAHGVHRQRAGQLLPHGGGWPHARGRTVSGLGYRSRHARHGVAAARGRHRRSALDPSHPGHGARDPRPGLSGVRRLQR